MHTRKVLGLLGVFAVFVLAANIASAAMVTLPNTSNTVTYTATVNDQCNIDTLPSAVAFTVNNHTISNAATAVSPVTIDNIIVADGKSIRLSLKANAAAFTPATGGTGTWDAEDVSWTAVEWTGGTGAIGTLNNDFTTYTAVATSTANAAALSTTALLFTLAGKEAIDRSGDFTLVATWKIEGGI